MRRRHFYPRSPRGERLRDAACFAASRTISIHAPREGSDLLRRRGPQHRAAISIHAPREGSDRFRPSPAPATADFYPRSPRGERRKPRRPRRCPGSISIHAPREGSDTANITRDLIFLNFYPRSPRGERPSRSGQSRSLRYFYPRSPRGERPCITGCCRFSSRFLSTLPARGATARAFCAGISR